MIAIYKPPACTDAMLKFLDDLRESGQTNMYGAAPYLTDVFGLDRRDARAVLSYWMNTFSSRQAARQTEWRCMGCGAVWTGGPDTRRHGCPVCEGEDKPGMPAWAGSDVTNIYGGREA